MAEYSAAGAMLRRYVHGPGVDEPIVAYEGAGLTDRRYLVADHQGSVIAEAGASVNRIAYGPFGEPQTWPTAGPRFRYTGQIALPAAQLYHYKARVYDPVLGRFLQTDPIGYSDDLNLYAYVANDPLNKTDPSGQRVVECIVRRTGDDGVEVTCRESGLNPFFTAFQLRVYQGDRQTFARNQIYFGSPSAEDLFKWNAPSTWPLALNNISAEDREAQKKADDDVCRKLGSSAARARCWASAADRDAARVSGRPLPPLVTR